MKESKEVFWKYFVQFRNSKNSPRTIIKYKGKAMKHIITFQIKNLAGRGRNRKKPKMRICKHSMKNIDTCLTGRDRKA